MASDNPYDMGFIPQEAFVVSAAGMDPDEWVRCSHCGFTGCDVRVSLCGCAVHARCMPLSNAGSIQICPYCTKPSSGLMLLPMSFREIDEAQKSSQSPPQLKSNRGRKRKEEPGCEFSASLAATAAGATAERRTGRWTNEEMALCDRLMDKFNVGELPVSEGTKLNEFLGNMLKSKQSRLTKKMKNAKLSTKLFQRTTGYLLTEDARLFSEVEDCFFQSILDHQERAEIKFHMQKEWREQFSRVCASIGQPLDADAWLNSVEEMDRRASKAMDAARMTRRKLMMGVAMHSDSKNIPNGVFIDKTEADLRFVGAVEGATAEDRDIEKEMLNVLTNDASFKTILDPSEQSSLLHSAPFLAKVTSYMQRHNVPFEHVDLWVPSFVPGESPENPDGTTCRLCYAGNSTVDKVIIDVGNSKRQLTPDEQFNLYSFGDYSQKFSFNIGCGLPGRVYEGGRPIWELSVDRAPHHLFERCGGAGQWGVKSVVGLPIASPNVGRIVVVLYSLEDRVKDEDLVTRLSDELTRVSLKVERMDLISQKEQLMPAPKWKLVVDIGDIEETGAEVHGSGASVGSLGQSSFDVPVSSHDSLEPSDRINSMSGDRVQRADTRCQEVITLLGKYMPSDPSSPLSPYIPGFTSLRLLMLRPHRSQEDDELVNTMLDSYSSYSSGGRDESDIAVMLARDFLYLTQQLMPVDSQNGSMKDNGMPSVAPVESSGLSLFCRPSIRSSLENIPALIPNPAEENFEQWSIFPLESTEMTSVVSC